jgi:hypothetical protein
MTAKRSPRRVSRNGGDPLKSTLKGVIRMDGVKEEKLRWLWAGRIAYGKVNIIEGDPGKGKSTVTLDLAARVTRGDAMPTGEEVQGPANALVITAEDGLAETIVPRLRAAGADDKRVNFLTLREDKGGKSLPFSVPEDMDRLTEALTVTHAKLVIIDPITAFLSASIQSHNDASVRKAMAPLAGLAEESGAAILLVRHLNKGGGGNAMYRGGGSIAFTGAARSVLLAAEHPDDRNRRVLAQVKGNLSRGWTPSLEWKVVSWEEDQDIPVVEWLGETALTADQILASPDGRKESPVRKECEDWLKSVLADGPMSATELATASAGLNFSSSTMKRARAELTTSDRVRDEHGKTVRWDVELRPGVQGVK